MNIAIVGCGYVAEFYATTLNNYADLKLVGVCDVDEHNLLSFCRRWSARSYADLQQLLDDELVEIVLNLTNPRSHFEITRRCIAAGQDVYSEKPLAMDSQRPVRWSILRIAAVSISPAPRAACWARPLRPRGKPYGRVRSAASAWSMEISMME